MVIYIVLQLERPGSSTGYLNPRLFGTEEKAKQFVDESTRHDAWMKGRLIIVKREIK